MRRSSKSISLGRLALCVLLAALVPAVLLGRPRLPSRRTPPTGSTATGGHGHAGKGKLGRHGSLSIEKESFGQAGGTAIDRYTLSNAA